MEKAESGCRFTFDNFKVTDDNKYAYETALLFSEDIGSKSVCVIGRSGSGKTHLLYAVRNYIKENQPELNVVIIDNSEFSSELVDSIRCGNLGAFKRKYIDCDVLLIDDVRYGSGKESLNNELSLIVNERSKSEKRIMVTTSEYFSDLSDRLLNRCSFAELAVIRSEGAATYSDKPIDDENYLFLNDMTRIHILARKILKGHYVVLQQKPKKIIRPDNTELFKQIVDPDKPELVVLASRPGMGKRSLALNIAFDFARKFRKEVDYFSWELSKEELTLKLLSKEALVDIKRLRDNKLETDDVERLLYCADRLNRIPLCIDDNVHNSGNIVFEKIKCRKKLGLIVVDYLELFHGCYNEKEHYIRFSDAIKKFKKLVNELKVPVVLLCELARDVEYNSDNRPVLKNISWKFDIDKADKIVFLYRDSYYNPNSKIPNVMELITAKNKNGKPGVIEFHSDYSLK